jgi:hypothetical protein
MKSPASIALMLLLLTGCATGPSAQMAPLVQCPRPPVMETLEPGVLEANSLNRMLNFLSGKLDGPIAFDYSLSPAKLPTNR